MNTYLNYFLEANIALLVLLLVHKLLLSRETTFRLRRMFLLGAIFASTTFPLIDVPAGETAPVVSISRVIPSYWLPEVVVAAGATEEVAKPSKDFWSVLSIIYGLGLAATAILMLCQVVQLMLTIRRSRTYRLHRLRIAESTDDKPTFSFFNFIFIGKANQLTEGEKAQIILHESVHAQQWHSFDILLVNVLQTVFWFNPFIHNYRKIFIQLHEFEADARAAGASDVNKYCSLLARVALKSAGFTLANHFNNSLTIKRIEMMRTIKHEIKRWKLAAVAAMIPLLFFFIACQDQVGDDIAKIAQNSTHTLDIPEHVRERYNRLTSEHPDRNYSIVELNETASQKMDELNKTYGIPSSIEVFRTRNGRPVTAHSITGSEITRMKESAAAEGAAGNGGSSENGERTYAIIEFNDDTRKVSELSQQDKVYTVVEQQPEFPGGYDSLLSFLRTNLRYPEAARQQGAEGTVYVSFVVDEQGTVLEPKVIRGITPETDAEALRVMRLSPAWIPGRQNKQPVPVRFVLPIKFKL